MIDNATAMGRIFMEAVAHDRAGRLAEAERLLTGLVALDPLHATSLNTLGDLLARTGRREEGIALVRRAIGLRPDSALYHRTAAEILRQLGRLEDALAAADRAVACDDADAVALLIRSTVQYDRLDLTHARADAQRAVALHPDYPEAHLRLGEIALLRGEFAAGWPDYDWNNLIASARPLMPPALRGGPDRQWRGAPMTDGTLLLITDQGFGDTIQFARYIPWARQHCRRLVLACDGPLMGLLSQIDPDIPVFNDWNDVPAFTAWSALSSLPLLHRTTVDAIPPYPALVGPDTEWRARLAGLCPAGARRVGLVWAGRPTHPNDVNRSTSLAALAPLTACEGVFLVSLQQGPAQAELATYRGRAPMLDTGRLLRSFADTAALIAALDLVITVDTAIAHLAGALGKPVWIMLPYAPDWRWMLGRDDSPWYPSARLFRQPAPRDWHAVATAVAAALSP